MSFDKYTQSTVVIEQTLCPMWNQTLLFNDIVLFGEVDSLLENPPPVVVEVYDKDQIVCAGLLHLNLI